MGVELFPANGQMDGRMDMAKLTVAFRNFANALKTYKLTVTVSEFVAERCSSVSSSETKNIKAQPKISKMP